MTTTTVYSGTADGYVYSTSTNAGYAVARDGTGTKTANTALTVSVVGQFYEFPEDELWNVYEAFLGFDTSAIADTDTVSAATLNLTSESDSSVTDFTIEARLYDWGGTLTTADFVPGADLSGDTLLASRATSAGWTAGTAYDLTSDAAFPANVSKTGTTYICVSSSRTRLNNAPTGSEYVSVRAADYTGTTSDPKLTVEHAAAGGTIHYGAASVSASATLAAVGSLLIGGGALLAGSATLAAVASVLRSGGAVFAATATLSPTGRLELGGVAQLSADAALAAAARMDYRGAAVLDAIATLTAIGFTGSESGSGPPPKGTMLLLKIGR